MSWRANIHRPIAVFGLVLGLLGCGQEPPPGPQSQIGGDTAMAVIEGEVFYRERIMLPPGAELEVQLEDISRADAMATVITTVSYSLEGGPPYPFSLEYDPARIDQRMRYALRARISRDGALLFTNTEYIDPFSGNPVRIMVQGMARTPAEPPPAARPDGGAQGQRSAAESGNSAITWILETLEGEPAPAGAGGKPIDLKMDPSEQRAAGFSGCNRYTGGFSSDGSSAHGTPIKFGPMAGTLMACPDGAEAERQYLQALGRVDNYRMDGDTLTLMAGSEVVATFKPR